MTYPFTPLMAELPDLAGKAVLITGGTGSFGRAFAQRLLDDFSPKKVIILSRDEQKHYAMEREMVDPRLRFFVGDIRDKSRLRRAFSGVDLVVHAAAMKHVHIAEYNPIEAIRTNVDGAANVIDAALECGVSRVVALSTDKAVSPVNLYGATKLCMEKLFVAANSYSGESGTQFDLVRYGNVVGSKGSVVPLFLQQRLRGRLTVTEGDMTRFWIGMNRAIDLVLLALKDGLRGEVFIPKLPACTVNVLTEAIAPGLPIDHIGIRPGEKMHETLITLDESHNAVEYGNYYVIRPNFVSWTAPDRTTGTPTLTRFSYSSDSTHALTVGETRALLRELGFIE
jgi:UDP-N-acetylglucosamine 4,6-dehydratase